MTPLNRALLACALVAAAPQALVAQGDIVVEAPTMKSWSATMSRALSDGMDYPRATLGEVAPEGGALVRFTCSDSGAPAGVALLRSSGDRRIDRAALDAVRRVKSMHPLPAGIAHDQRYAAALVFASSQGAADRYQRKLRTDFARLDRPGPDGMLALAAGTPTAVR